MNGEANGKHEPYTHDDRGLLDSDPLYDDSTKYNSTLGASWSHQIRSAIYRRRRIASTLIGAVLAFILLGTHSFSLGSSTSPRAIVQNGWRDAQEMYRGQFPVDGLRDFRKEPGCNFTSLDIHQPFSPLCRERGALLDAMSGGGRLGLDMPYWTRGCDMQWFQQHDICEILSRFDNIYFIGDSMLRHTAQALHVLMRGDLYDGGRATWREEDNGEDKCHCHRVFDDPGCVWMSAINTEDLLVGDYDSIKCPHDKRPAMVHWIATLNYPLAPEMLSAMAASIQNKDNPNGREVFIMDHGVWNDFEVETSMAWIEEVEDTLKREMPNYYQATDARFFPKLFITASAQGEGKPEVFHGVQNNIRLMRFTSAIRPFVMARGYEHLGLYNLTVQATSPDGTHATYENNLMKGMMVLNWLNMLDPPIDPNAQQIPLSDLEHNLDQALPPNYFQQEADPQVRPGAADVAIDNSANVIPIGGRPGAPIAAGADAPQQIPHATSSIKAPPSATPHVIDDLVKRAGESQNDLISKQTTGVRAAVKAYRDRRGRHPPPGFDKWVRYAEERNVMMVEDFFDQLYNDLDPFWAVAPKDMRDFSSSWGLVLSIRDGNISRWSDEPPNIANWMEMYYGAFSNLPLEDLPDVDLAFNGEDEPKLFVPYESMELFRQTAAGNKHTNPPSASQPLVTEYAKRQKLPATRPPPGSKFWFEDIDESMPLWPIAAETCPTGTPGRSAAQPEDYSLAPEFLQRNLEYMQDGYISNWTMAKSSCLNPNFRNLHASFIAMQSFAGTESARPNSKAIIKKMVPLLSGCKIHDMNSEILIPPAMQWPSAVDKGDFTFNFNPAKAVPWDLKKNMIMWRGSASGGMNNETNWTRFQRHRLLAMLNGTLAASHQRVRGDATPVHVPGGVPVLPHNFPLPDPAVYKLAALEDDKTASDFGDWINSITDAGFIHLRCWPPISWFTGNGQDCPYNGRYYTVQDVVPMSRAYEYKYQPDIDGASYSGRYRAILHSNSLPMKATIYDEWHDSRLIAWKHFVPMDVSNVDLYGLLEYFFGYEDEVAGHDEVARKIAVEGSQWANTVLRTEDMLVYIYRLVLEMARLQDDRRLQMGYVADLE